MSINDINNFADLVRNYSIMIPIIQRDYVQGNQEDEKIKDNRDDFIKKIYSSLMEKKELDLQFVYGIQKKNEIFMPIDGQQRITTSYLFSWFCSVKEDRFDDFLKQTKGFSYQVRTSSADFFAALRNKENLQEFKDFCNGKKEIPKCNWYKKNWSPDNTVNNSISMLRAIRSYYPNTFVQNNGGLFDTMLPNDDSCPIRFIVICQNQLSAENNGDVNETFETENRAAVTYINMNARGKKLTQFESLKNKLHGISDEGKSFAEKYDSEYINKFKLLVEKYKDSKQITKLDDLVREMDNVTQNMLVELYFDFKNAQNKTSGNKADYLSMQRDLSTIKEKNGALPTDYLKFFDCILKNTNSETEEIVWNYCGTGRRPDKGVRSWELFNAFWPQYKEINIEEWKWFVKHSNIKQSNPDDYQILYNVIIEIKEKHAGSTIGFLLGNKTDTLYDSFRTRLDKAQIHEEKIFAWYWIKDNNKFKEISSFDRPIRHLFYMCELWNDQSNDNNGIKWAQFKQYICLEELYFNKPDLNLFPWRKMYYLMALSIGNGVYRLPEEMDYNTIWNQEKLIWRANENPDENTKLILTRVKKAFDIIKKESNNKPSLTFEDVLNDYLSNTINFVKKDSWLYYVLKENETRLFENKTSCISGNYVFNDFGETINYFLFVKGTRAKWGKHKNGIIKLSTDSSYLKAPKIAGFAKNKSVNIKLNLQIELAGLDKDKEYLFYQGDTDFYYQVKSVDSNNGVELSYYSDSSIRKNIREDLGRIQNQMVIYMNLPQNETLRQNIIYRSKGDADYDSAIANIKSNILQTIPTLGLNYNYRIKTEEKRYSDLKFDVEIIDVNGLLLNPYPDINSYNTNTELL